MRYYSHNDIDLSFLARLAHPRGHIKATYDDLVNTFGKPLYSEFENDCEWLVLFREGRRQYIASIYNFGKEPHVDTNYWRVASSGREVFAYLSALDFNEAEAMEVIDATG